MQTSSQLYRPGNFPFSLEAMASRVEPTRILMVSPEFFDIIDVKNVHMTGHLGRTDRKKAFAQWYSLKDIYESLVKEGILDEVFVINGTEGCEDMVFAANQSFPWISTTGNKQVVLSKMRHLSRQREVPAFRDFYTSRKYELLELQQARLFEGMGDAIPLPGRRLLFGGFGHRSDLNALEELSSTLNTPVIALELINDKFYHLDTCFIPLDTNTVLLYPGAFRPDDLAGLGKLFKNVIEIPLEEAEKGFSLNAHCINSPNGRAAIIHAGNPYTCKVLEENGFKVYTTDTSEYIKSGGSVFCMKMMWY